MFSRNRQGPRSSGPEVSRGNREQQPPAAAAELLEQHAFGSNSRQTLAAAVEPILTQQLNPGSVLRELVPFLRATVSSVLEATGPELRDRLRDLVGTLRIACNQIDRACLGDAVKSRDRFLPVVLEIGNQAEKICVNVQHYHLQRDLSAQDAIYLKERLLEFKAILTKWMVDPENGLQPVRPRRFSALEGLKSCFRLR